MYVYIFLKNPGNYYKRAHTSEQIQLSFQGNQHGCKPLLQQLLLGPDSYSNKTAQISYISKSQRMLKINNYTYEYVYIFGMNLLVANQFLEALSWHDEKQMLLHPV